ncbi:MAG TPA: pentapeptide repeat-containing protein, partial [Geminicoccaceae bacterium]
MRLVALLALAALLGTAPGREAGAQDMLRHVDLASPRMSEAEFTREQVAAILAAATPERPADLHDRSLNGLDLSRLDLSGADLRWARLNRADLRGAKLKGAHLELAWAIEA